MTSLGGVALDAPVETTSSDNVQPESEQALESVATELHDSVVTDEEHPMEIILSSPGDQSIDYITPLEAKRFIPAPGNSALLTVHSVTDNVNNERLLST